MDGNWDMTRREPANEARARRVVFIFLLVD
jgi:hypothetical protein